MSEVICTFELTKAFIFPSVIELIHYLGFKKSTIIKNNFIK